MNRRVLTAWIAVVVMVVMAAGFAFAQRHHRGKAGEMGGFGLFSGRSMAHIQARLNLTEQQTQQIRQIVQQQRQQKQQADRQAREALIRAIFSDNPDQSEIQKLTQQLQQQHAARLDQMVTTGAQINQVLTAEQRTELQQMISEHQQVRQKMKQRRDERRQRMQQERQSQQ